MKDLRLRNAGNGIYYRRTRTGVEVVDMLRQGSGYKAQQGPLTLYVASDFDEWRIVLLASAQIIRGGRAFSEAQAKKQAAQIAEEYCRENGVDISAEPVQWAQLEAGELLNWSP